MVFFSDDGDIYAHIIDPRGTLKLMRGKKLSDRDIDTCLVALGESAGHRSACFKSVSTRRWFDERTMEETDLTYDDFLVGFKNYVFEDKNPEATYRIISTIAAVSRGHIFIPDGEGRYFRIPKSISPALEYASVNDNGGLYELQSTKERIIGFVDQGIYINVTARAEYEARGIILSPTITIP